MSLSGPVRGGWPVHGEVDLLVPRQDQVRTVEVGPPFPTALGGTPGPCAPALPPHGPRGIAWVSRERWRQAWWCASRKETSGTGS